METQQQKYIGEGLKNNNVHINFKKKEVKFTEIEGSPRGGLRYCISIITSGILKGIAYATIILMAIDWLREMSDNAITIIAILAGMMAMTIAAIPLDLIETKIRNLGEAIPKIQAVLIATTNPMKALRGSKTIKAEEIKDNGNEITLETFENIIFKYEATGEVAKYLKTIDIRNIPGETTGFIPTITWMKTPKNGEIRIYMI